MLSILSQLVSSVPPLLSKTSVPHSFSLTMKLRRSSDWEA